MNWEGGPAVFIFVLKRTAVVALVQKSPLHMYAEIKTREREIQKLTQERERNPTLNYHMFKGSVCSDPTDIHGNMHTGLSSCSLYLVQIEGMDHIHQIVYIYSIYFKKILGSGTSKWVEVRGVGRRHNPILHIQAYTDDV